jgi:pimeloyl-ACP methyl ester carboxylesterase
VASGARRLVLVGSSMGGGIVCQFLRRSQRAEHTWRVVLDAPVLDWRAAISAAARARNIPRLFEWLGVRAAERRIGARLGELDQVAHCHRLVHPILIIHGELDASVPPAASRALVAGRPDIVQLVEVAGAGHAQAWNRDPAAYEATVTRFLSSG